jgi:signal-transduction protein with cAMP-binding, CBS, and nucleotidyltransferase domain
MIEDGLIWMMPRAAFDDLRARSSEFGTHYLRSLEERLISALQPRNSSGQTLFMTPMGELSDPSRSRAPQTTIAEAALHVAARRLIAAGRRRQRLRHHHGPRPA